MTSISVEHLSVEFAIFGSRSRSLKNSILAHATGGRVKTGARDVVSVLAIDDLNVRFNQGDRIGLVGHNGSGKTTLLRVLAGIYKPSKGRITLAGKIGVLLDPAAGMDPDLTGLENIFLRGYLLGMSKEEILANVADISEFTDLGDFLELPMRTYSAGMFARLAFAISTAMKNEILLIDEGIGAGDADFQMRAQKRIERLFGRTPLVVLASHSEELIRGFCNRRITMEHGKLVGDEPI